MQLLLWSEHEYLLHLCYDFSGNRWFIGRLQMDRWALEVSIHKLIFFACVRMFHHIADTDEMNSLDFPLSLFPAPFPPSLWCNTTWILWDLLLHFVSVILVNLFTEMDKCCQQTPKLTPIFTRKKPLIFRSSVSDLIRVYKPQCGERNSMFSLLTGISRTFSLWYMRDLVSL